MALGFLVGKIPFGKFRLGGVVGSLLVGVVISQFGVSIDDSMKNLLFTLFILAVGFDSGSDFFRSLGKNTIREVILAVLVAATGLFTVWGVANLFGFNKGLAAGIASGGLTQSAIMGVAGDALARLGLSGNQLQQYTADVGVGYAVTYVFGNIGAIIVCVHILPKVMKKGLREAAVAEYAGQSKEESLEEGQQLAVADLVGRVYCLQEPIFAGAKLKMLEASCGAMPITVEKVKRKGVFLDIDPNLALEIGDLLLLVGDRKCLIAFGSKIGSELSGVSDMNLVMKTQEVILKNKEYENLSSSEISEKIDETIKHGIYIITISRNGKRVNPYSEEIIHDGDILKLYGADRDISEAASTLGVPIEPNNKTDLILMSIGAVIGLLVGMLTLKIGGIPLTLGSGGGVLLAGLFLGWLKGKHPALGGTIPSPVSEFCKEFGLCGFVSVVGLSSGQLAIKTVMEHGWSIFLGGVLVTMIPLLICLLVGKYILRYKNAAIFAGALCGARSQNVTLGSVLEETGNTVPMISFPIAYALANVFLTLLGPLIIALVN
jgi:aspartate-alanine antiporter